MIGQKRMLIATLGAMFMAGCDGSQTKTSQADQTELTQLQEEKKVWESERNQEKAKVQAFLDAHENKMNKTLSELGQVKDELKACQDKQPSTSEAKPEAKDQKTSVEKLLKK